MHSCSKVGKAGGIFGKIIEVIKVASTYTTKKTAKEIAKCRSQMATQEDGGFGRDIEIEEDFQNQGRRTSDAEIDGPFAHIDAMRDK